MKQEFSRQIFEKYSNIKFLKIRPVEAEVFHADRRTDRQTDKYDETNNRFSQFWNALKNIIQLKEQHRLRLIENKYLRKTIEDKIMKWQDFINIKFINFKLHLKLKNEILA